MNKKRLGVFCGVMAIAIVLAMIAVPAGAAAGAEVGAEVDWSDPEVIIHTIEELQQKSCSRRVMVRRPLSPSCPAKPRRLSKTS